MLMNDMYLHDGNLSATKRVLADKKLFNLFFFGGVKVKVDLRCVANSIENAFSTNNKSVIEWEEKWTVKCVYAINMYEKLFFQLVLFWGQGLKNNNIKKHTHKTIVMNGEYTHHRFISLQYNYNVSLLLLSLTTCVKFYSLEICERLFSSDKFFIFNSITKCVTMHFARKDEIMKDMDVKLNQKF